MSLEKPVSAIAKRERGKPRQASRLLVSDAPQLACRFHLPLLLFFSSKSEGQGRATSIMGYLKSLGTSIIWIYTALLVVTFWPGLYPQANFVEYEVAQPKALTGKLGLNKRLDDVKLLFQGQVYGPEAYAEHNGEVYTGLATGEIVKITKTGKLETVIKISDYVNEAGLKRRGRPLGMRFKQGSLYVADLALGLLKVDVVKRKAELIYDSTKKIENKPAAVPDDLDVASNGDIYWSDLCSEVPFDGSFHTILLASPCGRLIRYNAESGKNEVLLRDLALANGVSLAADESFVLVAESLGYRVVKYHLKGPRAGEHEIIVEGLPGIPDNVRPDGKGGFLISLGSILDEEHSDYLQTLAGHPYVRQGLARLFGVLKAPFEIAARLYPGYDPSTIIAAMDAYFDGFVFNIKYDITSVIRIDKDGKILDVAYGTKLPGLSSADIVGDELWLGTYHAPHVAKIPLKKAFPSLV